MDVIQKILEPLCCKHSPTFDGLQVIRLQSMEAIFNIDEYCSVYQVEKYVCHVGLSKGTVIVWLEGTVGVEFDKTRVSQIALADPDCFGRVREAVLEFLDG